jgi:hypothetical protein
MSLRSALIHALVMALATSSVMAQLRQDPSDVWRAFAEQLPPGALVSVHLKNGKSVEGHLVQVTADALHLNPKARIAVPVRVFAFDTIQSIDREKEGRSPGAKVLIGTSASLGALSVFVLVLCAAMGR